MTEPQQHLAPSESDMDRYGLLLLEKDRLMMQRRSARSSGRGDLLPGIEERLQNKAAEIANFRYRYGMDHVWGDREIVQIGAEIVVVVAGAILSVGAVMAIAGWFLA